mmetsp:Transcript_1324/g.4119  ORF Transcript_1324/g.4119 Transcript_1324/m.4119 type:complete len:209 (-) Transcript_1324:116-742(-)
MSSSLLGSFSSFLMSSRERKSPSQQPPFSDTGSSAFLYASSRVLRPCGGGDIRTKKSQHTHTKKKEREQRQRLRKKKKCIRLLTHLETGLQVLPEEEECVRSLAELGDVVPALDLVRCPFHQRILRDHERGVVGDVPPQLLEVRDGDTLEGEPHNRGARLQLRLQLRDHLGFLLLGQGQGHMAGLVSGAPRRAGAGSCASGHGADPSA